MSLLIGPIRPRAAGGVAEQPGKAVERPQIRERPRVLYFLLRTESKIYGGTRSILHFLENQRTIDPIVIVASPDEDDPAFGELEALGVPAEWIRVSSRMTDPRMNPMIRKAWRVLELIRTNLLMMTLLRRHAPDILHLDFEGAVVAGPAAKLLGIPLMHHVRGVQPGGQIRWTLRTALRLADRNIAIATSLRDYLLDGVSERVRDDVGERLVTIYNGFPLRRIHEYMESLSREEARRCLSIENGEIAIGLVGGLFPMKGQLEFLEDVAPQVADSDERIRFYLVGGVKDEAYGGACRAAVTKSALEDRVVFAGYSKEVFTWFRAIDVLAFPSLQEGFGRVAVEAQAFGVPVVANDIIGVRDAVADRVGGVLAKSPHEFACALVRLAEDAEMRERMGENGRKYVRRFDVSVVTRDLEQLYMQMRL